MLYGLRDRAALWVGLDYSEMMLPDAQEHLPTVPLVVGESTPLPFRISSFDRILCSGVLMYFRDCDYARRSVAAMPRDCADGGRVLLMDLPDLARRDEMEQQRAEPGDRKRRSSDPALTHLYYPREFFGELATALGVGVEVYDQMIPDYGNAPFRFNVLLTRWPRRRTEGRSMSSGDRLIQSDRDRHP